MADMRLSQWGEKMAGLSGVRSILADIAQATARSAGTRWLNLGAGNPALIPEVIDTWRSLLVEAAQTSFATASSRYGPARGAEPLVGEIIDYFRAKYGWSIEPANVLVAPGAQMLCFLATTAFTGQSAAGHKRLVLPSIPEYTGYQGLTLESDSIAGMAPRIHPESERGFRYELDLDTLAHLPRTGMMLVSSPSNPTGRTISAQELEGLLAIASQRDVPLVLDHAYGAPFPGIGPTEVGPPLRDNVINCFTFSKAGLPGERVAFAIGPADAIDAMTAFLANSALHAPQLIQLAVAQAMRSGTLDALVEHVIGPHYRNKRAFAEKVMHATLPETIRWRLHTGSGGMFCWLWIDEPWFDDVTCYEAMKAKGVFIVPGRHFFVQLAGSHDTRCVRLSLSADDATIEEGITRLAEALIELRPPARTGRG